MPAKPLRPSTSFAARDGHSPGSRRFPATRLSLLEGLAERDPERRRAAADLLVRVYWAPVAATLERRWQLVPQDVEDLTQEFFTEALARDWLLAYDPARARFRTFIRVCVDRFVANAIQARRRLKRGGGATHVPLDAAEFAATDAEVDERFRLEWVRSVFALALEALREQGRRENKTVPVATFEAYDVDDPPAGRPTYADLARRFGIPETTVANHLAWARRAFRGHVLDVLRSLAGSEAEYREDAQELLGIVIE